MENRTTRSRKQAPSSNLYTRSEAIKKLGLPKSTFHDYVTAGRIKKIVPPGKKEGYYLKKEIDELVNATQLFILQYTAEPTMFEVAKEEDIEGIYQVIESLWGKGVTTPKELRKSFYEKNPLIDYVVKKQSIVLGYLNIMPLDKETLELMLEGKKRGWDIKPENLYTFTPGNSYDCFVGLAVRQDVPNHTAYAMRLIIGFYHILIELEKKNIKIRSMYATSDRKEGMEICDNLGFEKESPAEGSTFNRYHLNLETSNSLFARRYREAIQKADVLES